MLAEKIRIEESKESERKQEVARMRAEEPVTFPNAVLLSLSISKSHLFVVTSIMPHVTPIHTRTHALSLSFVSVSHAGVERS